MELYSICLTDNKFLATPTDAMLIDGNTITHQCRHMFGRGYRWIRRGPHSGNPYHKIRVTNFGTVMTYGPVDYKDNGVEIVCVAIISADGRMFLSPPGRLTVHSKLISCSVVCEAINCRFVTTCTPGYNSVTSVEVVGSNCSALCVNVVDSVFQNYRHVGRGCMCRGLHV